MNLPDQPEFMSEPLDFDLIPRDLNNQSVVIFSADVYFSDTVVLEIRDESCSVNSYAL